MIPRAIKKETKFGIANIEKDAKSTDQTIDEFKDNEGKEATLNADMLAKFYTFDEDDVKDADLQGVAGITVTTDNTLDDAPTAADFAALNAFAKSAIKDVSQQRSDLGAIQNRLEHTIANLDNIVENTTSAESSIRDTDIATEMVRYSNNNILQQAGTSMLSQANQSNQLALSLLG